VTITLALAGLTAEDKQTLLYGDAPLLRDVVAIAAFGDANYAPRISLSERADTTGSAARSQDVPSAAAGAAARRLRADAPLLVDATIAQLGAEQALAVYARLTSDSLAAALTQLGVSGVGLTLESGPTIVKPSCPGTSGCLPGGDAYDSFAGLSVALACAEGWSVEGAFTLATLFVPSDAECAARCYEAYDCHFFETAAGDEDDGARVCRLMHEGDGENVMEAEAGTALCTFPTEPAHVNVSAAAAQAFADRTYSMPGAPPPPPHLPLRRLNGAPLQDLPPSPCTTPAA